MSRSMGPALSSGVTRRGLAVIGLVALVGCDRPAAFEPSVQVAAAFPGIVGNYAGTGTATLKTWFGSRTYSCSATISIPTQSDSSFTGTITVLAAGDCDSDSDSGTVAGVVRADTSVSAMAYASNGATVWQEGATRSGCRLVRSTPFAGTLSGDTLAVRGSGAYDCPSFFGTYRVDVDAHVSATRL